MNPFSDLYKTLTPVELIRIIDNPNDYQPLAVETARTELENRQLTQAELAGVREEIDAARKENAAREKQQADKRQKAMMAVADAFNPIGHKDQPIGRVIIGTSIMFCLISLYQVFQQFGFVKFMLFESGPKSGSLIVIYCIKMALPLIGAVFFWLRKSTGWALLAIYLVLEFLMGGKALIELPGMYSQSSTLNHILHRNSPLTILFVTAFAGIYLYLLSRKEIRSVYKVDEKVLAITIVLAIVWTYVAGFTFML